MDDALTFFRQRTSHRQRTRTSEASSGATTVRSVEWSGSIAEASIESKPGASVSIEAVRRSAAARSLI